MRYTLKRDFSFEKIIWPVFICMIVVSAILRIIASFHYPFYDEGVILVNILTFFSHRTLMPVCSFYPTLFSYLAAIPTAVGAVILHIQHVLPSAFDMGSLFNIGSYLSLFPARLTSVFFGVLTIIVIYKTGKRYFDKLSGVIAAMLLAFSSIHLSRSSLALPDVTMIFFVALSIFYSLAALENRNGKNFVLAGAFAGFAVSTKYNGGMAVFSVLAAHLIHLWDDKQIFSSRLWADKRILLSAVAFIGAFVIGSPASVLSPGSFWGGLLCQIEGVVATSRSGVSGIPYLHEAATLWKTENATAIFFLIGILYSILRPNRKVIVISAAVLVGYLYLGTVKSKYGHYLLCIYPGFVLLSGRALSELIRLRRRTWMKVMISLVVICAFSFPVCARIKGAFLGFREDNRWTAYRWIQNNIPEGSRIVVDEFPFLPQLYKKEQKEKWLTGPHKEFFSRHIGDVRTYQLIKMTYDFKWFNGVDADYLITSSYYSRAFFVNLPSPKDKTYTDSMARHNIYAAIKENNLPGWARVKKFDSGKGPQIQIFVRK